MCEYRWPPSLRRSRDGLTLAEVLILCAVCVVLVGLLVPGLGRMREASARVDCQKNLAKIAQAAFQFHDSKGQVPGRRNCGE